MSKTRQKLDYKKIVKLTDHTHACNDLTNFECEAHAMTGNGTTVFCCCDDDATPTKTHLRWL